MMNNPDLSIGTRSKSAASNPEPRQALEAHQRLPHSVSFIQQFQAAVDRFPDRRAVEFDGRYLSYRELGAQSNKLAHFIKKLGLAPEALIGVQMERSLELIVVLIAVLRAGSAFVPLDPRYPRERLDYMRDHAGLGAIVTDTSSSGDLGRVTAPVLVYDQMGEVLERESGRRLASEPRAEGLAYTIFTSGSTGRPRGVQIEHHSLAGYVTTYGNFAQLAPADRVLQFSTISFDTAVEEIFPTLAVGATLVLSSLSGTDTISTFLEFCRSARISVLALSTAFWNELAIRSVADCLPLPSDIRFIIFGGEAVNAKATFAWRRHVGKHVRLVNAYGPTEATIACVMYEIPQGEGASKLDRIPIGYPIDGMTAFVLDADLRPISPGQAAELWIGGGGLARGYLNDPELTSARFVESPFQPGGRLYKTGDICKLDAGGCLDFVGRVDNQLKVRGYRVEPDEIESVIRSSSDIEDCVVLLEDSRAKDSGPRRLVACLQTENGLSPDLTALKARLRAALPDYMVPSRFSVLSRLPRLPNGKLDRPALLGLIENGRSPLNSRKDRVLPSTPVQRFIADIWEQLLEHAEFGIDDNFFDEGGDSIRAARLIASIQARMRSPVYVVAIFKAPTIRDMERYLQLHYAAEVRREFGEDSVEKQFDRIVDAQLIGQARALIDAAAEPAAAATAAATKNPRAIFVLSPPRSGSTLTRILLGGHQQLFSPPELELLSFRTLQFRQEQLSEKFPFYLEGAIRAFMEAHQCDDVAAGAMIDAMRESGGTIQDLYRRLQGDIGTRTLVDKTSSYALSLDTLRSAEETFDQPLYIHLSRHPYAMIHSFTSMKMDQIVFRYAHSFTTRELAEIFWAISHQNILEFLRTIPAERQLHLKFEDVVRDTESALMSVCSFADIEYAPSMAQPYNASDGRMTDGIHSKSKMVGDTKFHEHKRVEPLVADSWMTEYCGPPLGTEAAGIAQILGYDTEIDGLRIEPVIDGSQGASHLVKMTPGRPQQKLFCVHPAAGGIMCYAELARALQETATVYAFQAQGMEPDRRDYFPTIAELAQSYIREMITVQPQGPYCLAGWSLGGSIVFEMSRQLASAGHKVAFVAMLDSDEPTHEPIDDAEVLAMFAEDLGSSLGGQLEIAPERLRAVAVDRMPGLIIEAAGSAKLDLDGAGGGGEVTRLMNVYVRNIRANRNYHPVSYAGKAVLFRATDGNARGPADDWIKYLGGPLDLVEIPGSHYTILKAPGVHLIADKLREMLQVENDGGFPDPQVQEGALL